MYYCLNCEDRFESPIQDTWGEVTVMVCPFCKDNDFTKLVPCRQCSDLKEDNHDKYCESCLGEVDREISAAIEELKLRWDTELVKEALTEWIENQ